MEGANPCKKDSGGFREPTKTPQKIIQWHQQIVLGLCSGSGGIWNVFVLGVGTERLNVFGERCFCLEGFGLIASGKILVAFWKCVFRTRVPRTRVL